MIQSKVIQVQAPAAGNYSLFEHFPKSTMSHLELTCSSEGIGTEGKLFDCRCRKMGGATLFSLPFHQLPSQEQGLEQRIPRAHTLIQNIALEGEYEFSFKVKQPCHIYLIVYFSVS